VCQGQADPDRQRKLALRLPSPIGNPCSLRLMGGLMSTHDVIWQPGLQSHDPLYSETGSPARCGTPGAATPMTRACCTRAAAEERNEKPSSSYRCPTFRSQHFQPSA
jgi:hypothetical protein